MSRPQWQPSRALLVALATGGLCLAAHAQTRGWLRYGDGNLLSGELVSQQAAGGVFKADRFGLLNFLAAEARFEAAAAPAVVAPLASLAAAAPAPSGWLPATWSVGLSGYWQRDEGSITSDLGIDLNARWQRPRDEVQLSLSTDYKVVDDQVDRNEQTGSVRWMHTLNSPWFGVARLQARRSTFTLDPLPTLDYLLLQATAGAGWRKDWSPQSYSLVALGHDRITLDLLRRDVTVRTHATSLLVENNLRLWPRVTLANTLYVYRWADGSTGIDSQAEVSYDLSDRVSVGLRHEYRRNAVNLTLGTYNRLSLTTTVGF
ncbi:DUF481 domain-containing protein [Roseateles sp. DC23W]|uniref:DUF481 domain-containing protein n=1 Tax=Pelomonas dachongensis TaxID=3299029 RepID=A0ABW7ETM9_9BURK